MQDEGKGALPHLVLQDRRDVIVRVPCMDDKRQPGRTRGSDVGAEHLGLNVAGRGVIEIVEPGFPDRHHFLVFRQAAKLVSRHVRLLRSLMRVRTYRAGDLRIGLRNRTDLVEPPHARLDGDHVSDACFTGARHNGVALLREVRKIQVAVAVDEHATARASGRRVRLDIAREHALRRRKRLPGNQGSALAYMCEGTRLSRHGQ